MRRLVMGFCLLGLTTSALAAPATIREVEIRNVSPTSTLPADLTSPEGKSRWHLESLALGDRATVAVRGQDGGLRRGAVVYTGPDAERWLLPDHDNAELKMGSKLSLRFDETREGLVDHVAAEVATVGIGWVHLPKDPHEVVLQRVLVSRQRAGERALRPELLVDRWVSPREGVLVEVSGPASPDGRSRLTIDRVEIVETVLTGASTLKVYADQLYKGTYIDVKYGYDARGSSVNPFPVTSLLTPPDPAVHNICDLVNRSTWNFSGINTGQETATTITPINAAETCNSGRCGYAGYPPGGSLEPAMLERLDRNLTGTKRRDNQVVQRESRPPNDVTIWLRAGTQNENVAGAFGSGETRFCFTDEPNKPKNEVPLWQFKNIDAGGFYAQVADNWTSTPVGSGCQEGFASGFSGMTCGSGGTGAYSKGCTSGGQTFSGAQFAKVVNAGVVTLPSGHTLNSLVVRNTTEFCNYGLPGCILLAATVRTIVYYWQAPYVGSVALLRGPLQSDFASGETNESPCTNFTTVDFTDISYGLFPPVSITAGATTDTTVALSWNPGNDTHRIVASGGYKIYWDTDPGASTAYAFNSVANAGQVAFVGTTATISGLTPGTTYYFTVTSLSDYTDPSSGVITRYESIRYPTTVSGDPAFSYPVEVAATTTCVSGGTPKLAVTNLTVGKLAPPNVHLCWTATTDACAVGYDILGSENPTSDVGWSVVDQVGLTTCWDGDPTYILVRARGLSGTGPWGHYGH